MLGNRIHRARLAAGLSLRDLGDQLSLSHAAIKKYEDNKTVPSSGMLIKLSRALHVRVEYFFRSDDLFILKNIQYRKHADLPEQHLKEITANITEKIERRFELEKLFPSLSLKAFSEEKLKNKINNKNDIEKLADDLRKKWNLGTEPLPNLIDIFEEQGIKVFEIDNQKYPKFDGLSVLVNDMPAVVIGDQWPGDRQRFTLAHELGHLLLEGSLSEKTDEEKYCDHFAGAFLLPKKAIINLLGEHRAYIEPREFSLLKQEFGISMLSILHRAIDAQIISSRLYDQLRSEFNQRGWVKQEPGEQYPQQKTHMFEKIVFHALAEEYISESKAAELMNMPLDSFRKIRAIEHVDNASY